MFGGYLWSRHGERIQKIKYYERYGGGANSIAYGYTKGVGLAAKIIGTFILVYIVLSTTDPNAVLTNPMFM